MGSAADSTSNRGKCPDPGADGSVAGGAAAARLREITGCDSETANLVAQRISMHTERFRGTGEISFVRLQRRNDELLFELTPRLVEREPAPHQLVYDLYQSTVQILLHHHTDPWFSEEKSEYHRSESVG